MLSTLAVGIQTSGTRLALAVETRKVFEHRVLIFPLASQTRPSYKGLTAQKAKLNVSAVVPSQTVYSVDAESLKSKFELSTSENRRLYLHP